MSAPQIDVFAQTHEKADVRWAGTDRDIPILYVGGVLVHLSQLGSDLRPWLLALSERLAEFAATVSENDGSRVVGAHNHDCSLHTCWRPERPEGCCDEAAS